MSWVKLDDRAMDDPIFLGLPRSARLLHVEALSYTLRHDGTGLIPSPALARITDDEHAAASVAALVDAGLWEVAPGGWRVVWLLDQQMGSDEIARRREFNRVRQERLRRHRADDHSICDAERCKVLLSRNAASNASRNALPLSAERKAATKARAVTRYSTYPDPTRPERRGGGGNGRSASASAAAPASAPRPRKRQSAEDAAKIRAIEEASAEARRREAEERAAAAAAERRAVEDRWDEWINLGGMKTATDAQVAKHIDALRAGDSVRITRTLESIYDTRRGERIHKPSGSLR